ncbi:MAG: 2-amino-4-hydroxy-6-hydroxymethyldihydropteridine diphosphokinase [Gammaproteobacteria bacterium]|nr:MAG: 2-amino-4-hydroxy-6-hydroxymethyldihydropteridine diphosphokinase [Gammaproteobacteria bacterium]
MAIAYIGLGSNLEDPLRQLESACAALDTLPRSRLLRRSSPWRSPPMGPQDQPDFLNAVACLKTELPPLALLDGLQSIEQRQGRVRERHWGPRTIDLDLLLMGSLRLVSERLHLPHPGIAERAFVLLPLAEVAESDLHIPGHGLLQELLDGMDGTGLQRLAWTA